MHEGAAAGEGGWRRVGERGCLRRETTRTRFSNTITGIYGAFRMNYTTTLLATLEEAAGCVCRFAVSQHSPPTKNAMALTRIYTHTRVGIECAEFQDGVRAGPRQTAIQ